MKRIISIALAFIMAATVYAVPATLAYADDEGTTTGATQETTASEVTPGGGSTEPTQTEPTEATQPTEPTVSVAGEPEEQVDSEPVTLDKVTGFSVVSKTVTTITLKWKSVPGAGGYIIESGEEWVKVADVSASKKETTLKNLPSSTGYTFRITAYVNQDDAIVKSEPSDVLKTATKPGKVKLVSLKKSFPTLKAKWEKKRGSGYEIWVSKSSKFKTKKKIKISSSSTLSSKLGKLTNNKKYYVKVRAFYTYDNKTYYGKFSSKKSLKVKSTGWKKDNGRKYYYKNGSKIKGSHKFNGTSLYFDKSTGELVGISKTMWDKVKGKSSGTSYLVAVSKARNRYVVYKKYSGHWCVYKYGLCTTGKKSTPSPTGCFRTTGRDKIKFGSGFTCWYATNIVGNVYFHSVICAAGTKSASGGQLGRSLSHGCIRLSLSDARWIYTNIGKGTKVVIY